MNIELAERGGVVAIATVTCPALDAVSAQR